MDDALSKDENPQADDIVKVAQSLCARDKEAWDEVYRHALDDLNFQNPDLEGAQWDAADYQARIDSRRPALTIDQLSQFVHQVANDIRMNTPAINVIPSGSGANDDTAEIFKGLIRNIEYRSNADDVYDNASLSAIRCSLGFIQVDHDYVDDEGFEQELLIKRVINPLSCWIDADSIECDGRDAKHGTILEPILVSEFKRQYPGKDPVSFGEDSPRTDYKDEDVINLAHFYRLKETARDIGVDAMGAVVDYAEGMSKKRTVKKTTVERYKLSGKDVLEETTFPGRYIPIIPVYGEENWINGKRHLLSLIRRAKDPQRMQNYWASLETELLQKMPNAPVMVAGGQIDDYIDDWRNPAKAAALRYKSTDAKGNQLPAPQRLEPPTIPTGIVNARREAIEDIKASMGLYNASIGARSNETSGKAINARKAEGDVATFHFGDNLVRSITQVGRVLVCAIPEIYDTPRIVRIIGKEDEPKEVGINGRMVGDQEIAYDLTQGKYDIRVTTGASFTTKRQETASALAELISRQPELSAIMGDIFFKNSDFAGADAMASRMEKWIEKNNPGMIDKEGKEVDPRVQQMEAKMMEMQQIIQQGAQELQALQQELASKKYDMQLKLRDSEMKAQTETEKMGLEQQKLAVDAQLKEQELMIKQKELELKEKELELKILEALSSEDDGMEDEGEIISKLEMVRNKNQQRQGLMAQEMERRAQLQQVKQEKEALEAMQRQAIIDGIQGTQQMIGSLAQAINKPKSIVFNKENKPIGIR